MATNSWNESTPPDNEEISQGASRIRELKLDVRERMRQGGHVWADNTTDDGKHATDVSGSAFTVYKSDHTSAALTVDDSYVKPGAGVLYRTNADKPVTYQRRALIWTLPYEITDTGRDGVPHIPLPCPVADEGEYGSTIDVELVEFRISVRTASSSATTLHVDLLRCPAGTDPTDGNFSSILTSALELPANAHEASTTDFASVTLAYNDKLVIDITQTDSNDAVSHLTAMLVLRW